MRKGTHPQMTQMKKKRSRDSGRKIPEGDNPEGRRAKDRMAEGRRA
jgi:hypothetical protein